MNDEQIEKLLRRAPRPPTPGTLLAKLQADLTLARRNVAGAHRTETTPLLRRWFPALSFAAILLTCLVAGAVQMNQMFQLRQENRSLRLATRNLEQLRRGHGEYQQLLVEHQELERLRRDAAELQRLRAEVAQLRAQAREIDKLRVENQQLLSTAQQPGQAPANPDFFAQADDVTAKELSMRCVNHLKQIGLAARIWANDNSDVLPPNWLSMSNELSTPKILICPADSTRATAMDWGSFSAANVSYEYLNPNGSEEEPEVVLARCPIHNHVCLSDGSVQQLRKNRSITRNANNGKYYILEPAQHAPDQSAPPENERKEMLRRYGLIPTNAVPPATPGDDE